MAKRLLSALLATVMLLTMFTLPSFAETLYSGTCGDGLTWTIDSEGVFTLSGSGAMPDYARGTTPWYKYRAEITSVVIEPGITRVGNYAFYLTKILDNITLSDDVTEIGSYAFATCGSVSTATFGSGVSSIEKGAFSGTSIGEITYMGSEKQWYEIQTESGNDSVINSYDIKFMDPGVRLDSDGYYRFYIDGEIQTKWQVSPEGYKYYFSTSSSKYGAALTGKQQKISSTYYDFTDDGKLIESYDSNGDPVLFCDPEQGFIYTIIYDAGEGVASVADKRFRVSTQADLTVTAEKEGYIFAGWTDTFNSNQCISSYEVTGDGVLYAVYINGADLKVELCDDGYYRYYVGGVAQTGWQVAADGYKYYFSTSSSKYGAAMTGTSVKIGGSYYDFTSDGKLIESYDSSNNPVLFYDESADCRPVVTYDYKTNGGEAADASSLRVTKGEKADLSVVARKSGSVFVGWNTNSDAAVAITSLTVTENVTLYAIFADYANNEVVLCEDGYYRYYIGGVAQTGWQMTPTGHKYYFSTSSSKYGAAMTGASVKIGGSYYDFTTEGKLIASYDNDGNPVLYYDPLYDASVEKHTVTYDYKTNGGSSAGEETKQVIHGNKADLTVTAEKADSTFLGWNTDKNADTALSELVVNEDVILYAIFKESGSSKVVLDSDGFYRYYINGEAQIGFWVLDGYKYYFSGSNATKGNAYVSQTATIGGKEYTFNSRGVVVDSNNVPVVYKPNAEVVYLSAVYSEEGTTLTWTGAVENGTISGYKVYRAEGENAGDDDFSLIAVVNETLDGTSYKGTYNSTYSKYDFETPVAQVEFVDSTTQADKVYIYKVEAIAEGDSASSKVAIRTKTGTERYVSYDEATDRWYYYIAGSIQTGWKVTPDGHKCYFSTSTTSTGAALEYDASIGSTVYNFTSYGALINSYDSDSNAVLYTEEIEIPGVSVKEIKLDSDGYYRYYIDGIIQTKWQTGPDGYRYFFSTSSSKYGAAMTGKGQKIASDTYDFTSEGKLIESYDSDGNPILYYDESFDMTPVVTYDHNNGSAVLEKVRVKKGEKADLTVTAKMGNLIFLGWNTDKNATEALTSYTVDGDVTLYAIFTDTVAGGTCGDNLTWQYKVDKTLFITGSGATYSWNNAEDVPWYAYRNEIERVVLDEEITNIGNNTLAGLSKIKTLNIPEKTLYITTSLMGCSALEEITVSSGNTRYNSIDGVLYGYEDSTLILYPQAKEEASYDLPATVKVIFPYAFAESKLEEITLTSIIVKIEEYAFYGCENLKKVKYPLTSDKWEKVYVLDGNDCLTNALECAAKMYTVTYDANGGTCATSSVQVAEGKQADLTVTAEKAGYVFAGWNTDKNAATGFESFAVNEDITLYAIYVEANDVVLCSDGYYRYYVGGVAQTGFWIINGYKYYFSTAAAKYGAALTDSTVKIKGDSYTFDSKGRVCENGEAVLFAPSVTAEAGEMSASQSTTSLKWSVSATNAKVNGYKIYRDGELIAEEEFALNALFIQGEYKNNGSGVYEYIFEPKTTEITYRDEHLDQNTTYNYTLAVSFEGGEVSVDASVLTEAYASRYVTYDKATDGWYYYINGVAQSGWQVTPDGYKYYFSKSTGKALKGKNVRIGSDNYDLADYGALIDSYDSEGNPVLYREINGWYTSAEDGSIRYYDNNVYRTGWQYIDGYKYYFSMSKGNLLTGMTQVGSTKYDLGEDGAWVGYYQTEYTVEESPKATDVVLGEDGYYRYYPNGEEGEPLTGWKVLPGEDAYYKYYFSKASTKYGAAVTGYAVQVGIGEYNFFPTGALLNVTVDENGQAVMEPYSLSLEQGAKNGLILDEDGKYRYYIDGEFQSGWITIDGSRYLLRRADGSAVTDVNYKYGSYYYDFTEDGKLVRMKNGASSIYKITFAPGEGTGEEIVLNKVAEDCFKYVLPENTFEKEGYVFFGWSDGVNTYAAGTKVQVMKDTVFTAVWAEEEVEIIANGTVSDTITWSLNAKGLLKIEGSGEMPAYFIGSSPWYSYRESIKSVSFSNELLNIGQYSMYGCAIESVEIPEGVKYIGDHVFENCDNLKTISIPASVIDIETYTFTSTPALESITVAEGNKNYYSKDGVLFYKYGSSVKIIRYPSAKEGEYTVPEDVVLIDIMAFENCDKLTKVTMTNVQSIDRSSFASCGALETVVTGDKLITIGDYAFSACTSLKEITLPKTLKSVGNYAFNNCKALYKVNYGGSFATWVKITIGTNNSYLKGAGFVYGSKDYTVTFVDWDGTTIATLTVPDGEGATAPSDPEREGYTFTGWDKDFSVVTGDITVTAQYEANVVVPETVASGSCGSGITWELDSLGTMTISGTGSMRNYSNDSSTPWYSYSSQIKKVVIGEGVTRIGDYSFAYCRNITEVTLPDTLKTLGLWSLAYTGITKLDVPEGVTKINERALLGCLSLAELSLPKSLSFIGALAFNGCTGLEKVVYYASYATWTKVTIETGNDHLTGVRFIYQYSECKVTFVDFDGTVLKTETVEEGNRATAPEAPSRDGYTFIGWDIEFSNVTEDITVTAQYEKICYTVTFVDFDGTVLKTESVEVGSGATAPEDPTRDGYTFTGWDVGFTNVTSNLTVTAQYESVVKTYKVIFIDEIGNIISEQTVEEGKSAVEPEAPVKSGYTFIGWNNDFTNVTSNLYVMPQYEKIKLNYTVNFVDYDATVLKTETVLEGNGATAPSNPEREGYIFLGWNSLFAKIDRDRTITAIYDPEGLGNISHTGTFGNYRDLNNAHYTKILIWTLYDTGILTVNGAATAYGVMTTSSGGAPWSDYASSVKEARVSKGIKEILIGAFANCTNLTKVTFSEDITTIGRNVFFNCPALTDIYFEGTREQWEDVAIDSTNDSMLENVTVHCSDDVKTYTVTFLGYNGQVLSEQTVNEGESATAPEAPSVDLYTFTGWNVDFSKVTSDLTVTAQYERSSFMVYFIGYEGIIEAQIIPKGGSATAPDVPAEIDGNVFIGWDGDFENVTSDLNIYAIYTMVDPGPGPMPEDGGEFGDGLTWHYDGNMTLTISGNGAIPDYDPTSGDMVPWQSYDMYIKVIEIEEGITGIGSYAFGYLVEAMSISIPSTVTYISEQAFLELMAIELVTISDDNSEYTVKDGMVFTKDETHLVYCPTHYSSNVVELDEKVKTINSYAFAYNHFLEAVNVDPANEYFHSDEGVLYETATSTLVYYPAGKMDETYTILEGTEIVREKAFYYTSTLTELCVPASVKHINGNCFSNATSIATITVSEDNETYASVEGNLTDKEGLNLYYCPTGTVPNGVQEIWTGAFDLNCVFEITIPVSVTQVHSNVFYTFVNQINYLGSYEEWNAIYISNEGNDYLEYANINYN